MGQRLIISEEDRNRIAGMHNLVNEQRSMEKPEDGRHLEKIMKYDYGVKDELALELGRHYEDLLDGRKIDQVIGRFETRNPGAMVPATIIFRLLA